jgi:hypothetical protein
MTKTAERGRAIAVLALAATLLSGCAGTPIPPTEVGAPVSQPEIGKLEIVIVLNLNNSFGTHTGMFLGNTLNDPAGGYLAARTGKPWWQGPSLEDYIRFQREDGDLVQIYRYTLSQADFDVIASRVRVFGFNAPMYCAADVQNEIAGVGPFKTIKPVRWTSPVALGEALRALPTDPVAGKACTWPSGRPC